MTDYLQRQGRHACEHSEGQEAHPGTSFIPHKICLVIHGIVVVLEWMENGLK